MKRLYPLKWVRQLVFFYEFNEIAGKRLYSEESVVVPREEKIIVNLFSYF